MSKQSRKKGGKSGSAKTGSSTSCGDVTLADYANASVASNRLRKVHTSFDVVREVKNLNIEEKTWDKKLGELEEENNYGNPGTVELRRCKLHPVINRKPNKKDEIELKERRNNLVIYGISETQGEDTNQLVMQLCSEKLGIKLPLNAICWSHREGDHLKPHPDGTKRHRRIIVQFAEHGLKERVYTSKRKLKGCGVIIQEHLSDQRFEVYRAVVAKYGRYGTYTLGGNVFWMDRNGKHMATCLDDLREKNTEKSSIQFSEAQPSEKNIIQQIELCNNLIIHGISETWDEDTNELVMQLCSEKLGIELDVNAICSSQRDDNFSQPNRDVTMIARPIIVQFLKHSDKQRVLANNNKLKGSGLTIQEHLTTQRLKLYHAVVARYGEENTRTFDGNVVWRDKHGAQFVATCLDDLRQQNMGGNSKQISKDQLSETLANRKDEIEQNKLCNSLRIIGLSETPGEDTNALVMQLCSEKLGINLPLKAIRRSHRIGNDLPAVSHGTRRYRPIIVQFVEYRDRQRVYAANEKLKGSGVRFEERLTAQRSEVYKAVVARYGQRNTYTLGGNVVWRDEHGKHLATCLEDLELHNKEESASVNQKVNGKNKIKLNKQKESASVNQKVNGKNKNQIKSNKQKESTLVNEKVEANKG